MNVDRSNNIEYNIVNTYLYFFLNIINLISKCLILAAIKPKSEGLLFYNNSYIKVIFYKLCLIQNLIITYFINHLISQK